MPIGTGTLDGGQELAWLLSVASVMHERGKLVPRSTVFHPTIIPGLTEETGRTAVLVQIRTVAGGAALVYKSQFIVKQLVAGESI